MTKTVKADYTVTALVRVEGAIGVFGVERIVLALADPADTLEIIRGLRKAGWETHNIVRVEPEVQP